MTEDQFLASVRELAGGLGWLVYHTHDSRRSPKGFPDLVMVRGDRVIYRELKTATGKVTPEQSVWIEALAAAGADVDVWRPADLEQGVVSRELLNGNRDRTFEGNLNVRLMQARMRRQIRTMRSRGHQIAPMIPPATRN